MTGKMFRLPAVITISRKTWEITGIEYADLDAVQVCEYATRLARALDAGEALQKTRVNRADTEKGGLHNVTFSNPAGIG